MVNMDTEISTKLVQLRIIMILSMCLHNFLVFFPPNRETTRSKWRVWLIWVAHSSADWVAVYGLGLISGGQATENVALWASLLLLHQSSSDATISGLLEDNYLWVKQLVSLVAYAFVILIIFFKSIPNKISIPTLLVIVAGLHRMSAQFIVMLLPKGRDNLKDSRGRMIPAVDHTKLAETCSEMARANMPIDTLCVSLVAETTNSLRDLSSLLMEQPEDGERNEFWLAKSTIALYKAFKCFMTKASFSSTARFSGREFFRERSALRAFHILATELKCMYVALYTWHHDFSNHFYALGVLNKFLVLASFLIFGKAEKHEWNKFDIVLSYVLLSAALAQEFFYMTRSRSSDDLLSTRQRWSESVCHINLLAWCLGYHSKLAKLGHKLAGFFCADNIRNIVGLNLSVSVQQLSEDIKEVIFWELRTKSSVAIKKETAIKICSQRGDWALMRSSLYNELHWSLGKIGYGESLILWHTATQLCYNGSEFERTDTEAVKKLRTFCKIISDYMLYLLVLKPDMMVSMTGDWEMVFNDTCAHARGFFLRESITNLREAYKQIMCRYSHMPRRMPIISEHSKSVLVDASVLAKQLQSLEGSNQWKLMSQVWVELLSYAALHCEADIHARQPSQGGELLTFVWLLINHLGFGKQVLQEDAPAKESIVEKNVQSATAEFNGVKYTNASDLELVIPLEFLSCIQSEQIIPIQRISNVLMPAFLHYLSSGKSIASKNVSNSASSSSSSKQNETAKMDALFFKIQHEIEAAKGHFEKLKQWEKTLDDHIKDLLVHYLDWKDKFTDKKADDTGDLSAHSSQLYEKLCQIDTTLTSLRLHIEKPSNALPIQRSDDLGDQCSSRIFSSPEEESPDQSSNARFSEIVPIGDFQACYDNLSHNLQKCLLYFSAFPAKSQIRKKALTYLWIGEGFTDDDYLSSEEIAARYFQELVAKGLIEPVDEDSGDFSSCKMNPSIHSAVVRLAKDSGFFDFDGRGKPTTNYIRSRRACLSRTKDGSLKQLVEDVDESNADKLYTLFNLDETFLKFPEDWGWLSKIEKLMTLCLGSWRSSDKTFFMVENTDFLEDLCELRFLKCLSLNRTYKITKLPSSIGKLVDLKILDLKACHCLREIPNTIGSLENLTHLDISECHLIDDMPKGISRLVKLQVLKGFVIPGGTTTKDQCGLADLAKLEKLRKLSIYTNRSITGYEGEFNCLSQFKALQVLTISWIKAPSPASNQTFEVLNPDFLPGSLQKLDLRCWPLRTIPLWVNPLRLDRLKKLYIRGGSLNDLTRVWTVKILRLQHLKELKINWATTLQLFPNLVYLHKIDCPKIVSFPADGVWRSHDKPYEIVLSLLSE